jgi:hypothetical protein
MVHPGLGDSDYMNDHRQLWDFWGLVLSSDLQVQDIYHRRDALKILHPEKVRSSNVEVIAFCDSAHQLLDRGSEEAVRRSSWLKDGKIKAPGGEHLWSYQEIPEVMQRYMVANHLLDFLIAGCSECYYFMEDQAGKGVPVERAQTFFDKVLENKNKAYLSDLLRETIGVDPRDKHIGILFQKLTPAGIECIKKTNI